MIIYLIEIFKTNVLCENFIKERRRNSFLLKIKYKTKS